MVNHRRKTLGPVTTNRNRRMSIGVSDVKDGPAAAAKQRSSNRKQRMSMMPRMNISENKSSVKFEDGNEGLCNENNGGGISPPVTKGRKSMGVTSSSNAFVPADNTNSNSNNLHNRRHTISRSLMQQDPRPSSDKTYFNSCIRKLLNYLVSHDYEYPVKLKDLSRPSAKDFNHIVTFLLRLIDPTFNTSSTEGGLSHLTGNKTNHGHNVGTLKFEDEVSLAFRALGYPFNISKTALVAAGSPHTWPTLLMALTWLIELLECAEQDQNGDDPWSSSLLGMNHNLDTHDIDNTQGTSSLIAMANTNESNTNHGAEDLEQLEARTAGAFLKYVEEAYNAFLAGDDQQYDALEEDLVEYFERDNMAIEHEIEKITDENAAIVEEINNFATKGNDVPERQKRLEDLAMDVEKFHELVRQLEEHKATLLKTIQHRTKELQQKEEELNKRTARVAEVSNMIGDQEMSVEEMKSIKSHIDVLKLQVKEAASNRKECEKHSWRNEETLKKMTASLEEVVHKYLDIVKKMDLDDQFSAVEIREILTDQIDQKALLGVDMRCDIAPALSKMKDDISNRTLEMKKSMLKLTQSLESSEDAISEFEDEAKILGAKKQRANDALENESMEQVNTLTSNRNELHDLEDKIKSLKDPVAFEEAITKYQKQCLELKNFQKQNREKNQALKDDVVSEFKEAVGFCSEHKDYRETKLKELKIYIKNKERREIDLDHEDEVFLSSLE